MLLRKLCSVLLLAPALVFGQGIKTTADTSKAAWSRLETGETGVSVRPDNTIWFMRKNRKAEKFTPPILDITGLLPALNGKTTISSISGLRSMTLTGSAMPQVVNLPSGAIYYLTSDTTSPDDSVTTVATPSTYRYKLFFPYKRLTPYDFGAKGDGVTDDYWPLQRWLNSAYDLFWALGKYLTTKELYRFNKGAVTITGAGTARTKLLVPNNTNGLIIENPLNGVYGIVNASGFEVISTGPKSATTTAFRATTQHEQRPGFIGRDISIKSLTAGQEWGKGIHLFDCSQTSLMDFDVQSATIDVTEGVVISNSPNRPSVEHNLGQFNMRAIKRGFRITSTGVPGVEGVHISTGSIVVTEDGVLATSPSYGAPLITVNDVHMNTYGGEPFHSEGYLQIKLTGGMWYVNRSATKIPRRAVYMKNTLGSSGEINLYMPDSIANAFELAGSGQDIDFTVRAQVNSGRTNLISLAPGYFNTLFGYKRTWTGNTSFGPNIGKIIVDSSGTAEVRFHVAADVLNATDGSFIQFNSTLNQWKAVSNIRANIPVAQFLGSSSTIDARQANFFQCYNGSTTHTHTIDVNTLFVNQILIFKRYDGGSTGTINLQTSNPSGNHMQDADDNFQDSVAIPITSGQRQMKFRWNGTNLEFLGY